MGYLDVRLVMFLVKKSGIQLINRTSGYSTSDQLINQLGYISMRNIKCISSMKHVARELVSMHLLIMCLLNVCHYISSSHVQVWSRYYTEEGQYTR